MNLSDFRWSHSELAANVVLEEGIESCFESVQVTTASEYQVSLGY